MNTINDDRFPAPIMVPMDLTSGIEEYRLPGDANNVVRINSKFPDGADVRLTEATPVMGTSFDDKIEAVHNFVEGHNRALVLVREPDNPYDRYAIAVHGTFTSDEGGVFSGHIGYVPKELAKKFTEKDLLAQLILIYTPEENKGAGIRMALWEVSDFARDMMALNAAFNEELDDWLEPGVKLELEPDTIDLLRSSINNPVDAPTKELPSIVPPPPDFD